MEGWSRRISRCWRNASCSVSSPNWPSLSGLQSQPSLLIIFSLCWFYWNEGHKTKAINCNSFSSFPATNKRRKLSSNTRTCEPLFTRLTNSMSLQLHVKTVTHIKNQITRTNLTKVRSDLALKKKVSTKLFDRLMKGFFVGTQQHRVFHLYFTICKAITFRSCCPVQESPSLRP